MNGWKTYKSSSFFKDFTGTRKACIEDAIQFVNAVIARGNAGHGNRFSWRASDESGFVIAVHAGGHAYCAHKWNASRFDAETYSGTVNDQ